MKKLIILSLITLLAGILAWYEIYSSVFPK